MLVENTKEGNQLGYFSGSLGKRKSPRNASEEIAMILSQQKWPYLERRD